MVPDGAASVLPRVGVLRAVGFLTRDVAVERHAPRVHRPPCPPPSALGRAGNAVPPPEPLAGCRIVGVQIAAASLLSTADAGDDAPLDGDRRAGHVIALLVVADL